MSEFNILGQVHIASPCHADWDAMQGDDRARYCGDCRKHVYNLSALRKEEAEALILEREGNLCVRYYQRRDGTVLTADCPVGVRVRRRRAALHAGMVFSTLFSLTAALAGEQKPVPVRASRVVQRVKSAPQALRGEPTVVKPPAPVVKKGEVARPTPPLLGKPVSPAWIGDIAVAPPRPANKPAAPPPLMGTPAVPPQPTAPKPAAGKATPGKAEAAPKESPARATLGRIASPGARGLGYAGLVGLGGMGLSPAPQPATNKQEPPKGADQPGVQQPAGPTPAPKP